MGLEGKVALVTGGSRGIGAAIARRLSDDGAAVVVNCKSDVDGARALVASLQASGREAVFVRADVGRPRQVERLFSEIDRRYGRIDVLVAAAGANRDLAIRDMTLTDFNVAISSQLNGTFLTAREAAMRMAAQGGGQILTIGASTGIRGRRDGANYCAAKAGVMVLTKCFALEFAPHVRVNCLVPGFTETEDVKRRFGLTSERARQKLAAGIPLGRLAQVNEIAAWASWIVGGAPYATGALIFVNGGSYLG